MSPHPQIFTHPPPLPHPMKKLMMMALALCFALAGRATTPEEAWRDVYPRIESQIKAPSFPDKDYRLLDYGKKSKTKGYLYTELINRVITLCSEEGGGRRVRSRGPGPSS